MLKPYKKDARLSYTAGAYVTFELINTRPEQMERVFIHPSFTEAEKLTDLCVKHNIEISHGKTAFRRINEKENTYVAGLFRKYSGALSPTLPHVVLVNPSDMGNLGSIIRTLTGLNLNNIAVINPAADIWHPKTIRASMGAVFRAEVVMYDAIEQYRAEFPEHRIFSFMLDGQIRLEPESCPRIPLYTMVFGNEATGLPPVFHQMGETVRLPQSCKVDSFNLSVAVGIGAFMFASVNGQL